MGANMKNKRENIELTGVPLKIYVYLLESKEPKSVREIAETLNMAPSSIHYHLKKLASIGIIKRDINGYTVNRKINIEGYIILMNKLIPRLLIYSLFFLGVLIGEIIVILGTRNINIDKGITLLITSIAFILFFYEGLISKKKLF
ncbi:MAG: winged helix-turn-helix transcriptional regulator [Staphylothermus sp.]|nr:winged helix-turn-helix transcriptional regulator [Staphylothermus sp.]